ncbi:hypothetical protein H0H93_004731 [Arthromyces matolae]|nr:hypothetical protein H0H93_004731 [Arthromyces matolae]
MAPLVSSWRRQADPSAEDSSSNSAGGALGANQGNAKKDSPPQNGSPNEGDVPKDDQAPGQAKKDDDNQGDLTSSSAAAATSAPSAAASAAVTSVSSSQAPTTSAVNASVSTPAELSTPSPAPLVSDSSVTDSPPSPAVSLTAITAITPSPVKNTPAATVLASAPNTTPVEAQTVGASSKPSPAAPNPTVVPVSNSTSAAPVATAPVPSAVASAPVSVGASGVVVTPSQSAAAPAGPKNINNQGGTLGVPTVTSLPDSDGGDAAGVSSGDQTSFTEIPFTTNTIVTTSASTFTSDNQVFTSAVTISATQVLSTRVPVPSAAAITGATQSSNTSLGAVVGGSIGAAILLLAIAVFACCFIRRRRRREEALQNIFAHTPEPFFPAPLHSSAPMMTTSSTTYTSPASYPSFMSQTNSFHARSMSTAGSSPRLTVTASRTSLPSNTGTSLQRGPSSSSTSSSTSTSSTNHSRKKPVPYLDVPVSRPGSISLSGAAKLNPISQAVDPFADPQHGMQPLKNPFDDVNESQKK